MDDDVDEDWGEKHADWETVKADKERGLRRSLISNITTINMSAGWLIESSLERESTKQLEIIRNQLQTCLESTQEAIKSIEDIWSMRKDTK